MPNEIRDLATVKLQGPGRHHPAILQAATERQAGARTLEAAFDLAKHAITLSWASAPYCLRNQTFMQYQDLLETLVFADAVLAALAVGADFDRIGAVVEIIRAALRKDHVCEYCGLVGW
ncbi:hypothetical protein ACFV4P_03115 [Kitasatospora sp. NPDC059795]|uniref:hypothetical protein n=1 Tax=Kitasatospora sp. NPDC059795 TaxID=3346949 RepID=UPI003660BEE3